MISESILSPSPSTFTNANIKLRKVRFLSILKFEGNQTKNVFLLEPRNLILLQIQQRIYKQL